MRVEVRSIKPIGKKIIKYLRSQGDKVVTKNPEFRIVAYYDKILTKKQLTIPTINLHPGYLPYNRGVHTHIWSIVDDTPAGVTIHQVNEKVDQGDIIAQQKIEILPTDTAGSLEIKINSEMFNLFKITWPKIKTGDVKYRKQKGIGTYHWKKEVTSFQEFNYDTIAELRACTFKDRSYAYFKDKGKKYYFGIKFYDEEVRK